MSAVYTLTSLSFPASLPEHLKVVSGLNARRRRAELKKSTRRSLSKPKYIRLAKAAKRFSFVLDKEGYEFPSIG